MDKNRLLDRINSPEDLKYLSKKQLNIMCEEIRNELIDTVSNTGGHLSSNLGVVELTVALHRVFNSPEDQIVWDVGHQCYTHKLLTGRRNRFETIRQYGGLSGYTKTYESAHDPFGAGHSSTSISAAYGMAKAKTLKKEDGYVIAVIGDGALTGGLAYEGLNNAGRSHDNLIVILNDNKMSISKNVGAIARHLAVIRAKPGYLKTKDFIEYILNHTGIIGKKLRKIMVASKSAIKNTLYHSTIFEDMGFVYLGPGDGHNIEEICRLLERAKTINRPCLIHLMTVKGKGYTFAEADPRTFHGVSQFDVETGDLVAGSGRASFSDVFGKTLIRLAEKDESICAITAAMAAGTGLTDFAYTYRQRFFDVGIAEEHAVVFAAGLARNGMIPVFAVYSTFLQRAYDQILHDAALQDLKVVFAIDRAGLVGEDGETHQGVFDAAFLNTIPGMVVYSPTTNDELQNFLYAACYETEGPACVRYPRGCEPMLPADFHPSFGSFDLYGSGSADILLITYGRLFAYASAAADELKRTGRNVSVLKLNRIKPIDQDCFEITSYFKSVYFFEEGIRSGGVGENFLDGLNKKGFQGSSKIYAIDDQFVAQGNVDKLLSILKLDTQGMVEAVLRECENEPKKKN
ncbi:MAG TPA: 1-deoxy-D-xylulose-5-phosphate synthase [Clostridia bacterium]|nr:1-deoxy-D-xylulose-5-phosphate synthase [Clostridia bacterium]